jgi:hypothetical protein
MANTLRKRPHKSTKTRARKQSHNRSQPTTATSEQKIILTFLEILNTIKLYHWKTHSHPTHKATDELHSKLSENVDTFVETMLGKNGHRVQLTSVKSIPLNDFNEIGDFKGTINAFKTFLINLRLSQADMDLLNIRDEMLGHVNQFLYLLTFK